MSKKNSGWMNRAMAESRRKANPYLQDPTKLQGLSSRVQRKMDHSRVPVMSVADSMRETWSNLGVMGRLVRAFGAGRYRRIPWAALGSVVAGLIYFVTPTDFIPDFVAGLGLLDDAAIIALVVKSVATVLEEFRAWERTHPVEGVADAARTGGAPASGVTSAVANDAPADAANGAAQGAAPDVDGFVKIPIALDKG